MKTLSRTILALSTSLMVMGAIAGAANAAEAKHHARHLGTIHAVSAPHDACASMVRPPDGGWWGYNIACPHGG